MQEEQILFENFIDEKYKVCLDELFADKMTNSGTLINTFKLDSMANGTSTVEATLKFLKENAPEFIRFLIKKHSGADTVNKRIQDDPDFIKLEFLEFVEYERILRLQYFQEAILEK